MSKEDIVQYQFQNLTAEQQQKIARMGGKESVKKKKEIKTYKDIWKIIGNTKISNEKNRAIIKKKFPELDPTNKVLMAFETFGRMFDTKKTKIKDKDGNDKDLIEKTMSNKDFIKYQEYARDTMGEKPIDKKAFTTPDGEDLLKGRSLTISIGGKNIK